MKESSDSARVDLHRYAARSAPLSRTWYLPVGQVPAGTVEGPGAAVLAWTAVEEARSRQQRARGPVLEPPAGVHPSERHPRRSETLRLLSGPRPRGPGGAD